MPKQIREEARERAPLSRERVIRGAVAIAVEAGIGSLTMRSLARALGVKPMSLYHYVANKEEILDDIVDFVFGEIELPAAEGAWRSELRRWATSARRVLRRHPWAIELLESRASPGPATLRHHDTIIGILRTGGFSVQMAAHAYALLDSYLYGFALQEAALPFESPDDVAEVAGSILQMFPAAEYPHLFELATKHVLQPGYDFGNEFAFGLEMIFDGLAKSVPDNPGEELSVDPTSAATQ